MRMIWMIALLLARGTAGAQECPKYQHAEGFRVLNCHGLNPDVNGLSTTVQCEPEPIKCVDDLHVVTEKEWQELQERLAEHEHFMAHEARQEDEAANTINILSASDVIFLEKYYGPDIDTEQPQQTTMVDPLTAHGYYEWYFSTFLSTVPSCRVHEAYNPKTGKCEQLYCDGNIGNSACWVQP